MSSPTLKSAEPVAGYALQERIGAGGYGEVWKVEAPGGLTKAMKFIFGRLGEERAVCELKALNRIKEVRHPFLLSLERIEVVDGQLVIITELAEASLKDRFTQCKKAGQPGIPRDELLVYLADAADALDYMSENYSLQHLDVKPENLLVVGGRVKVADFGLVKDIHDATVSLIGGLTPVYAAPEVYDARPSRHSDQYSLAIVYQEMLTGLLPFPGRTPAQLAAQHLNSRPRLGALPPADQEAIARALAKEPGARFPSCRAMVEALVHPEAAARRPAPGPSDPAAGAERPGDTAALDTLVTQSQLAPRQQATQPPPGAGQPGAEAAPTQTFAAAPPPCRTDGQSVPESPDGLPIRPTANAPTHAWAAPEGPPVREAAPLARPQEDQRTAPPAATPAVIELGPIAVGPEEARLRPTLVIGVGGTAARALRRLRGRLTERFGSATAVPAVGLLLIDTDSKTLVRATHGDETRALTYQETIAVPLRPAHDYRSASKKHLNWLSRRWLYNIPRSLETEGMRPLGRLAMVDHSRQLFERVRAALAQVADPQSLAASAKATGLEVDDRAPRVLLVASIAGGTGSGMVLDLGYAMRAMLAELGYPDEGVCGILAHSAPRHPNAKKLAAANAGACLGELAHYAGPGAYPGDPACGLPPFPPGVAPFHQTYVVPLGEDLDSKEFEAATALLADYLYLNTVTTAAAFFDRCRRPAEPPAGPGGAAVYLRTFGLSQAGRAQGDLLAPAAKLLSRSVVNRWCGRCDEPDGPGGGDAAAAGAPQDAADPAADAAEASAESALAGSLQLGFGELTECVGRVIRQATGDDAEAYFCSVMGRYFEHRQARGAAAEQAAPGVGLLRAVNAVLGTCALGDDSLEATPGSVEASLEEPLAELASERAAAVCRAIVEQLDDPARGVNRARRTAEWFVARLRSIEADAVAAVRRIEPSLAETQRALLGAKAAEYAQLTAWGAPEGGASRTPKLGRRWLDHCAARLDELALLVACNVAQSIRARITTVGDQLADLKRELGRLADTFEVPASWTRPLIDVRASGGEDPAASAVRAVRERIPGMAADLDSELRSSLLARHGGLLGMLGQGSGLRVDVLAVLPRAARAAVSRLLSDVNVADMLGRSDASPEKPAARLRECLQRAAPRLADCGGARRLLAVCPDTADPAALAATVKAGSRQEPTVLPDAGGDLTLCYEVGEIPLPAVAASLMDHRPELAEIAARVHTRIDVAWTGL